MNEIEAISVLETRIKYPNSDTYGGMCEAEYQQEAVVLAIEALREKQARSQGCDYCLKTHPKHNGHSHIWHGNMLDIGYGVYLDINYCPKCGRKLTANVEIRFA
jgi:hypothetical protein